MIDNLPEYVKLKNSYNPLHYPANKKIPAEEWNALWLATMYQGNHQEDVLASILNGNLPEIISNTNSLLTLTDTHSANIISLQTQIINNDTDISQLQTDVDIANNNANDAVRIANTANTNSETAVSTANEAKETADNAENVALGIDAKASDALSNSETAVSTANEAKTAIASAVPNSRKVNNKALSEDIVLKTDDISDAEQTNKWSTADEKEKVSKIIIDGDGTLGLLNDGTYGVTGKVDSVNNVLPDTGTKNVTLTADNISDSTTTNKFATEIEKTEWNNKAGKADNNEFIGKNTFKDDVQIGTAEADADLNIKGTLNINGDIIQNGSSYETHAEQVYTTSDEIILRDGAEVGLAVGEEAGLKFKKYDGTNDGALKIDKDGIVRVGDVGSEQPLATREETPINAGVARWDNSATKFVTETPDTTPTASSTKLITSGGTKAYADTKATKVEVAQGQTLYRSATGTGEVDTPVYITQTSATANTIAKRTSTGAIFTATAIDNAHAVNKLQMDSALNEKFDKAGGTITGDTTFNAFMKIVGTAADRHLLTRGIGGASVDGLTADDLYINYGTDFGAKFGKTGQSRLKPDGGANFAVRPTVGVEEVAFKSELNTQSFSKVYKAITELTGITTSSTLAQVCDAMSDNSYLNISTSGCANLVPTGETDLNGQLEIIKVNANRVRLAWSYQNASRQPIYFATYRNAGGFLGWKRFITDTEAQSMYATNEKVPDRFYRNIADISSSITTSMTMVEILNYLPNNSEVVADISFYTNAKPSGMDVGTLIVHWNSGNRNSCICVDKTNNVLYTGTRGITSGGVAYFNGWKKLINDTDIQTITGLKTFEAPANIAGTEQATTKFKTSNGGSLIIGKEGVNSGTMLRFDQVDGTTRLLFRASATPGAMVWAQPENNAQLLMDLADNNGVNKRITFSPAQIRHPVKVSAPLIQAETMTNGTYNYTMPNQNGELATTEYVDTKLGDIESLLAEV